jgi:hypothetical protein
MRAFLAALAFAGALMPFAPAHTREPAIHVAQMSRDVTGAVRRQRNQKQSQRRWKTR